MTASSHPLENPIWEALAGPHAELARIDTLARRYDPEIALLGGMRAHSAEAFAQLRGLCEPGGAIALFTAVPLDVPGDWRLLRERSIDQMLCETLVRGRPRDASPMELGEADVPDMLALVSATEPGPFGNQTYRCGRYLGVRAPDTGELVALSGERLRLADFVEISAVCTAPSHRGQGLARMLMEELASAAFARGQAPFLHVKTENASAVALYEAMGFRKSRTMHLTVLQRPA